MLTLIAQPFRRGHFAASVVSSAASSSAASTGRRVIGGVLEFCSLAAILAALASAVVRIH